MHAYLDLLSHRPVRWPIVTSTIARITPGMIVLAIVLMLREADYGYAAAGAVTAAHQLGVGIGSPVQGRLADRFGQLRVLLPDAALYLLGTVALAAVTVSGAPVAGLAVVAVVTGLFYPPVTACARVYLSREFPSGQRRETAFAITAIAVEVGFIVGPLGAVAIGNLVPERGAAWAVVVAGLLAAVGAGGYAATPGARSIVRRDVEHTGRGGALRSPGVRVVAPALGAIAVAFGVFDIVIPAVAELAERPSLSAVLIACIASGSMLAGLVYGSRMWPGTVASRLRVLSSVFAVGLLLLPLTVDSLPVFAVALFLAGIFLGPMTICAFQLIDDLALPGTQTEAQSWTQSAIVAGVAVGAGLSGVAVDRGGAGQALLLGALVVGLAAIGITLGRRSLASPLRGTDALTSSADAAARVGGAEAAVMPGTELPAMELPLAEATADRHEVT